MEWDWRSTPSSHGEVSELFHLLSEIHDFTWRGGVDDWKWKIAKDGLFTVSSAKKMFSNNSLGDNSPVIKWKGWVPLKCKIMVWRLARNRLPTVSELLKRGVNLSQTSCIFCQAELETALHLFTGCVFSHEVWYRIEAWCRLSPSFAFDVIDLLRVPEIYTNSKEARYILRGIVYTTLWVLWNERNDRVFNNKRRRPIEVVENVKSTGYFWFRNRSRRKDVDWKNWCIYPLV